MLARHHEAVRAAFGRGIRVAFYLGTHFQYSGGEVLTRNRILAPTFAALLSVMTVGSLHAQSATVALCKDGKTSTYTGRGACSSHGGLARLVVRYQGTVVRREATVASVAERRAAAARAAEVPQPSVRAVERANANSAVRRSVAINNTNSRGAIALCQDGLYSHAARRRDACLHHDGVARWM